MRASPIAALALLGLASCGLLAPVEPVPIPPARPAALGPAEQSEESKAIARHFARVQADLVSRGLMRRDGGGPDVPFSTRNLAENFVQIALYDEYVSQGGMLIARSTPSRLRRWEQPIRMSLIFGDSIPQAQRRKDAASIAAYARRLSRLTGLPITMSRPEEANFHVLMLHEDERRAFGPRLRQLEPGIDATALNAIVNMPRSTFCLVFAFSRGASSSYSRAVAVIRGEHPDLMRQSCIHEELAQGMGLANDSPAARPSVFNDDEEFALLTSHDELLLEILYDPRLRPGMTPGEARPIVQTIAAELTGGAG
ncbi:DUF2927 domain-containing protein [Actibacterium sp. MT2.3-13A]|uniref:DUF2927 domain-containing protein n=1 Tax=Actibacterium sp. MT2.3-13A TaxID=2828332 RepID=UPI001BA5AF14|nr:DUF2927 domain-containing protein [Actibacterium sp. MT2.3-13A]